MANKPRVIKKQTQRQKMSTQPKKHRLNLLRSGLGREAKRLGRGLGREIYLPLPDNKIGRFLNKKRHFIPKFFRESWAELRLVTWPSRRETWKLTIAVFMFAIIFGLLVAVTDFGLDKIFRKVILK